MFAVIDTRTLSVRRSCPLDPLPLKGAVADADAVHMSDTP